MRLHFRQTMLLTLSIILLLCASQVHGANGVSSDLSPQASTIALNSHSPHRFFMSADSSLGETFDEWKMDTGYAYSVLENIDLYIATRISNSSEEQGSRGFLSGVNYKFNHKISLNSAIYASPDFKAESLTNSVGAEVSGKYMLTDSLNLKATIDYEDWQSAIEVKLGFSF
ncbi:hypothetical protein [Vibrio rarus]|uniref:hypothetical protein n=1 Tax=Vibrio rarus TaxID=413403 RepID=UPI0021C3721D|nr:hypothetical protein [Vibrio rarus]